MGQVVPNRSTCVLANACLKLFIAIITLSVVIILLHAHGKLNVSADTTNEWQPLHLDNHLSHLSKRWSPDRGGPMWSQEEVPLIKRMIRWVSKDKQSQARSDQTLPKSTTQPSPSKGKELMNSDDRMKQSSNNSHPQQHGNSSRIKIEPSSMDLIWELQRTPQGPNMGDIQRHFGKGSKSLVSTPSLKSPNFQKLTNVKSLPNLSNSPISPPTKANSLSKYRNSLDSALKNTYQVLKNPSSSCVAGGCKVDKSIEIKVSHDAAINPFRQAEVQRPSGSTIVHSQDRQTSLLGQPSISVPTLPVPSSSEELNSSDDCSYPDVDWIGKKQGVPQYQDIIYGELPQYRETKARRMRQRRNKDRYETDSSSN